MVEDLEDLVEKYGGLNEVNLLWKRVAGRPFISDAQSKIFTEDVFETLSLFGVPIVLLGAAHASRRCAKLAETWVKRSQPSTLVLERCPERLAELAWPKSLLMDRTSKLRAVNVFGRGEVSVDELRRLDPPSRALSLATDDEAQVIASNLWAEFELLNAERNHQVDEAAFLAWSNQSSGQAHRLLALADKRISRNGITSARGGGPDRESLSANRLSRDVHMCDCIAACACCSSGPILAVLGLNHVARVSSQLQQAFGAKQTSGVQSNISVKSKIDISKALLVERFSGALLGHAAIDEILLLYTKRREALQVDKRSAEDILVSFIEDSENSEALFETFLVHDFAIEMSSSLLMSKL